MYDEDGNETSPRQWWRDHERDYKTLSDLAKKMKQHTIYSVL